MAIFLDLSKAMSRKWCNIGGKLVLIFNRKYMGFRLVPKSVTLNDREQRNSPYFALYHRIDSFRGALRKSG